MDNNKKKPPLLEVIDLHTSFTTDNGEVQAVNGVSFVLEEGKTLGIVGESGSGKSVTAYSIMRILRGVSGLIWIIERLLLRRMGAKYFRSM